MNMESFERAPSVREEVLKFLSTRPEYAEENRFSQEEIAFVIKAVDDLLKESPKEGLEREDLIKRAFDARVAVRGGADSAVVDGGEIVGIAESPDKAKEMMFRARSGK
ncbi:MAG: hypothetical protein KGH56_00900 [Patescibacteria group bacterium]|nr:hypothetical protein [Patescibacteria group bacterium]